MNTRSTLNSPCVTSNDDSTQESVEIENVTESKQTITECNPKQIAKLSVYPTDSIINDYKRNTVESTLFDTNRTMLNVLSVESKSKIKKMENRHNILLGITGTDDNSYLFEDGDDDFKTDCLSLFQPSDFKLEQNDQYNYTFSTTGEEEQEEESLTDEVVEVDQEELKNCELSDESKEEYDESDIYSDYELKGGNDEIDITNEMTLRKYKKQCPDFTEFQDMKFPKHNDITKCLQYLRRSPLKFINVMKQTKQLSYKYESVKSLSCDGWTTKLYVIWLKYKFGLVSHIHNTKKESRKSVAFAFHRMATCYSQDRSFATVDNMVAYYIFAPSCLPCTTGFYTQDC
jgi:hypothetical protein